MQDALHDYTGRFQTCSRFHSDPRKLVMVQLVSEAGEGVILTGMAMLSSAETLELQEVGLSEYLTKKDVHQRIS